VSEIIERMCAPVSPEMRRQALSLDLARLDQLQESFHEKALAGDVSCAAIVIKISERRAALLGLDVPAHIRGNQPVQIEVQPASTHDRIRAALEHLATQRLPPPSGNGTGDKAEATNSEPAG
jgi:hypothetical protein